MKNLGITNCKPIKESDIDNNRYLDCADYDDCLQEAVMEGFTSFHCRNCHAFQVLLEAREEDLEYEVDRIIIKKFKPGSVELKEKNIGTLWWD